MATTTADHSFSTCYMELCRQQRLRPLPMICVTLPHSLDFTTDRVKMDDWAPILNSLSFDRTLRSISVRSKYQCRKFLDHANSESKARAVGKAPVVLTRYLLDWLSHSVGQCVRNSAILTTLELEGIPIPADCLAVLCVGLAGTKSLQHLSLQRCYIGDAGCELVCRTIADVQSIRSLNLAQCNLTSASGPALASALSRQKLSLYHDAWKQSLRYREPKLESMPGLRRLTLNANSKLGNEAVTSIIEAIRDSLWFKALDLQQCGVSEDIAHEFLDLLEHNKTLVIVDVRLNHGVREETLNEISRRLDRNDLHSKSEYRWLSLPPPKDGGKRVSSAGNLQKAKLSEQESKGALSRPRSAIVRQVKRPPAPIIHKKPLMTPMPQLAKRLKVKPPVPVFERRPRQPMKPPGSDRRSAPPPPPVEVAPKVSLHLDLQSQIQSLDDSTQYDHVATQVEEVVKKPRADQEANRDEELQTRQLQEIQRQLAETRKDLDRQMEEIRRHELLLAEERARREFAETKLRSAKNELAEMEEVVRRRDRDSRGYLVISQKSMEELCLTFTRLIKMLEESTRKSNDSFEPTDSEEENLIREEIKRRFVLIIRKTKSENLKRGLFVDDDTVLSRLQMTARYGRSEGNIRTTIEPLVPAVRVERNIGDTVENEGLPSLISNYAGEQFDDVRHNNGDAPDSRRSHERARAIFASIINGEARLSFNVQMR